MSVPKGMKFNKSYPIPDEWKVPSKEMKERIEKSQEKLKQRVGLDELIDVFEAEQKEKESESRMNVIGQNGNDGLHYENEKKSDLYTQSESFPQADTD